MAAEQKQNEVLLSREQIYGRFVLLIPMKQAKLLLQQLSSTAQFACTSVPGQGRALCHLQLPV